MHLRMQFYLQPCKQFLFTFYKIISAFKIYFVNIFVKYGSEIIIRFIILQSGGQNTVNGLKICTVKSYFEKEHTKNLLGK